MLLITRGVILWGKITMNRYKTLIGLIFSIFLLMAGQGMIAVLLPERILELALSESSAGYLASTFALTYILVQVPLGRISDRHAFKPFIMAGYLLIVSAGAIYHFAGSPVVLFLGRMVQGMGEAPLWALAPALLSIQFPAVKGRVFGLYNAALALGLTVGPLLTLGIQNRACKEYLFLVFAAMALTGAVLVWLLVREDDHSGHPHTRFRYSHLFQQLKRSNVRDILTGVFLYGGGYGLLISIIPAFLLQTKGLDQTGAGLYFTLIFFSMGLSQLLAGPLIDRWGAGWFMTGGLVLTGSGFWAFPGLSGLWIHLSLLTIGLGLGIFGVTSLVYLNNQADRDHKGEISGLYYLVWGLGYLGLPLAGVHLGQALGLGLFFRFCAGLSLLAAILSGLAQHRDRRRPGQRARIR